MAEVAGTIVGVISLSIQLFDQFSKYTNSVKDARKRAEQITRELDTLVNHLENLETIISKLVTTTAIALTKTSIHECARAIETIRARLGDAVPETSSGRFWSRSRIAIKRLAYPFKEGEIKYWKEVLTSIQQSLQIALLASMTDQQQQYFTTLQAQFDQLSLHTNAGIQMIIDQQRRAETTANRHIMDQSHNSCVERLEDRIHPGAIQPSYGEQHQVSTRNTSLGLRAQTVHRVARSKHLYHALLPVSAVGLEEEMTSYVGFQRSVQPNLSRLETYPNIPSSCTCRGRRQDRHFAQRPLVVSLTEMHLHDPSCSYWVSGSHGIEFGVGIILCYLVFGLKIRLFMKLLVGSGTFSIMPSLTIGRIVTVESSPAFKLIDKMTSRSLFSKYTLPKYYMELRRVFETGQASPHDRLEDGKTLLHSFCQGLVCINRSTTQKDLEAYRKLLKQLLSYMTYADASDTDDYGRTCIDLCFADSSFRSSADHVWRSLASDLFHYGLKISSNTDMIRSYSSWVELPFDAYPDPFVGLSNATVAAFLRSEVGFSDAVGSRNTDQVLRKEEVTKLYHLTTRMGWVRGCQILFDAGYSYMWHTPRSLSLLFKAINSRSQAMVKFWLAMREHAKADHLADIGSVEAAVGHAFARSELGLAKIIVAHLVEERHQLRQLVLSSGIGCECVKRSKGVLDAHAVCAITVLEKQGYKIAPSLRPTSKSIYDVETIYYQRPRLSFDVASTSPLEILQILYDAGFNDIAKNDIEQCHDVYYSPLHSAIAFYRGSQKYSNQSSELLETVDWFLANGANMNDCQPKSRTTTVHLMSAKLAMVMSPSPMTVPEFVWERVANLFQHTISDSCKCSCSTHGCTSVASFYKHLGFLFCTHERPHEILKTLGLDPVDPCNQIWRPVMRETLQCIAKAARSAACRWTITELIRLCVFAWLDIRHTCCDLEVIMDPLYLHDASRPTPPRYPQDELHRIQEEDAYLVSLLEDLVPSFDARYDTHEGDLLSFVDNILIPEMNDVLDRLKQEDEAAHAAGRRAMGVIMVDEGENGLIEEDESESLDEVENDAVDE